MESLLTRLNSTIIQREDNYDNPLPNFLRICEVWIVYKEDYSVFEPRQITQMMDLYKTVREMHSHTDDNLLDKVGYSVSCYERIDERLKEMGYSGIEMFRLWVKSVELGTWTTGTFLGKLYDLLMQHKEWVKNNVSSQDYQVYSVKPCGYGSSA